MDKRATPPPEARTGPATPTNRKRAASGAATTGSGPAGDRVNKGDQSAGGTAESSARVGADPGASPAWNQGMIQATALAPTANQREIVTNLIHIVCVS